MSQRIRIRTRRSRWHKSSMNIRQAEMSSRAQNKLRKRNGVNSREKVARRAALKEERRRQNSPDRSPGAYRSTHRVSKDEHRDGWGNVLD